MTEDEKRAIIRDAHKFVETAFRAVAIVEAEVRRLQPFEEQDDPHVHNVSRGKFGGGTTIDWLTGKTAVFDDGDGNVIEFKRRDSQLPGISGRSRR